MTNNQARDIIINQINHKKSQTFLIEGSYKVGQMALAKSIIQNFNQFNSNNNANDIIWIKKDIEKSSIGLSEIEVIKHNINQTPLSSPYTFFIIEEADFLTKEAQNALLKIIEEPSKYSIIFLLGTYHQLLPTIYSRCLTIYLDIMELQDISLGHYDLQLEMQANPNLFDNIEQVWGIYLNILTADEIEIFNYTQKLQEYPIDLVLFVLESIHFVITLAYTDKTSYTNIKLSKSLNQELNNIINTITPSWNYKALSSLQDIKKTILFSNRKNILALEEFLLSNHPFI
jgi:hypothetical protein